MPPLTLFAQTASPTTGAISSADLATAAGAILAVLIFTIATYVITSIMLGRIFKKAGTESWTAWVPIYNTWKTLEIGGQKGWWAILFIIPLVNIVAMIYLYIAMYDIGLRLGKDGYFVLWAIFLPYVWYAWLAFDKSTWQTPTSHTVNHPAATTQE